MPDNEANRLRRIDAVLKQVEVKFALGRQAEHLTALENVRSAVEAAGDPRRRATWHCWTGYLHGLTGGPAALAIGHCREAAAIAAAAGCDDSEGFIYSCAVQAYLFGGELRAAIEAGDRAVPILEAQNNLWWASRTLWNTAQAAIYLGEWEAGLAYCRRVLAHATTLDDRRVKIVGLYRLGSVHIFQGDIERGLRCCEEALTLNPPPFDVAMAKVFHGYGQIKAGRLDGGIAELTEAIAWFDRSSLHHVRVDSGPSARRGLSVSGRDRDRTDDYRRRAYHELGKRVSVRGRIGASVAGRMSRRRVARGCPAARRRSAPDF